VSVTTARACSADPVRALAQEGLQIPDGVTVIIHEASDDRLIVVLPDPDVERQLVRLGELPDGVVKDVPETLQLEWRGFTLVASGRIDAQRRAGASP